MYGFCCVALFGTFWNFMFHFGNFVPLQLYFSQLNFLDYFCNMNWVLNWFCEVKDSPEHFGNKIVWKTFHVAGKIHQQQVSEVSETLAPNCNAIGWSLGNFRNLVSETKVSKIFCGIIDLTLLRITVVCVNTFSLYVYNAIKCFDLASTLCCNYSTVML